MAVTSLMVVGGFLGAGKTTSILALARFFLAAGKKIGIVTNDQGSELVDTNFLASEGLSVLEVTGGCFCCNFDQLTERMGRLADEEMPDIILAEPVGSCTDLMATIFKPMLMQHTGRFALRPLSVVTDPRRVKKLMMKSSDSPFPDEINYLFQKQLEEADVIALNKIDLLTPDGLREILAFLQNSFPGAVLLPVSAKTDSGISEWASRLDEGVSGLNNIKDIDYDIYAAAEAHLGWLNSSFILGSVAEADLNREVRDLIETVRRQLVEGRHEIAHLKVYAIAENDWLKASLTGLDDEPEFNREFSGRAPAASLIINARVNADPGLLREIVETAVFKVFGDAGIKVSSMNTESFKPGRPNPQFRIQ